MPRKRRSFTKAFKAETVQYVAASGRTVGQVAKELDLTENSLREWVQQAKVDAGEGPAGSFTSDEKGELAELRRENRVLRMERDFLKKCAAFFAKENT